MRRALIALALVAGLTGGAMAQDGCHYINGIEGIKCGSVPPPGWYFKSYNVWYNTHRLNDKDGDKLDIGFDVNVLASAERLIWITDVKILGADYGMDVIVPFMWKRVSIDAMNKQWERFGVYDICVEPLVLSWHGAQWDAAVGLAVWAPTGEINDNNPATSGMGYWTLMPSFGGTVYFDKEKTWSASALGRYETHSYKVTEDARPGDDFHFEWGVGKTINKVWDVGVAGYCQWQVTKNEGSDANDTKNLDRVFAAGPEVVLFVPQWTSWFSLRVLGEFGARNRPEGWLTTLTWTKAF